MAERIAGIGTEAVQKATGRSWQQWQARGLRVVQQEADGFAASASKTFDVPLKKLYAAWSDTKARAKWLREHGFTVRKATANKSMRITWVDGKTHVDVNFYDKGPGKSQVAVQHTQLDSAQDVEKAKASWKRALGELGEWLAKQG
jgi:hypothetical protein